MQMRIRVALILSVLVFGAFPAIALGLRLAGRMAAQEAVVQDLRLNALAESAARSVQDGLTHHMAGLAGAADMISQTGARSADAVVPILKAYRERFGLKYVYWISIRGKVLAAFPETSADGRRAAGTDFSDREYFTETMRTRRPFIAHVRIGRLSGKPVFGMAVPVWNRAGTDLVGVLGSSVSTSDVYQMVNGAIDASPDVHFTVIDGLKQVMFQKGEPSPGKLASQAGNPLFAPVAGRSVNREGEIRKGVELRASLSPIQVENVTWIMAMYRDKRLFQRGVREVQINVLLTCFAVFVFSFCALWLVVSYVSSAMADLVVAMGRIGDGKCDQADLPSGRPGLKEVRMAWRALSRMAQQLKSHADNLEAQVQLRTAQLADANRRLEIHHARATAASRLAALGELAAGIAHEVNTPLAAITFAIHGMRRRLRGIGVSDSELEARIGTVSASCRRIGVIVGGLNEVSRDATSDPLEQVGFEQIAQYLHRMNEERLTRIGIRFVVRGTPEVKDAFVLCRRMEILQLFLRVLNNAVDSAGAVEDKWIIVAGEVAGDNLVVSISDSGRTGDDEDYDRFFSALLTTRKSGFASDLGLYLSRGIAEYYGGTISMDGTSACRRVVVRLPLVGRHPLHIQGPVTGPAGLGPAQELAEL